MKLDIITDPNPILRQPSVDVHNFDIELQTQIDDMVETMRTNNGMGLAAPQVGMLNNIIVCEFVSKDEKFKSIPLTVLCNPKITYKSKNQCRMVEGCLSFPGKEIVIKRPRKIKVEAKDRYGKDVEIEAPSLFSRILQHEIDHLNSTLMIDHLEEISVVFFGSGDFGIKSLELLHKDLQYQVKLIVSNKFEKNVRGKIVEQNQILATAQKYKIPYILSQRNNAEVINKIKKLKPELGVVIDYGAIIPPEIIELFKYGIINLHPSLLPKHRGPSPIQDTILSGDKKTGATAMLIDRGIDSGPTLSNFEVKLKGKENYEMLKDYLSGIGASLLLDTIPYYIAKDIKPVTQNNDKATFSKIIKKVDGEVFINKTKEEIVERKIRAYSTWPKVFVKIGQKTIQICAAHFEKDGQFIIDRVKPEGKNEMTYDDFVRGYHTKLTFLK